MAFRNLAEMTEFMDSCETTHGNMTNINKLLDKVNNYGVESLDKYELEFWTGVRNMEDYEHHSTDVGNFFLFKLKELGIIENCSNANISYWDIFIFEMNCGLDYNKNHNGTVEIMIEDNPLANEAYFGEEVINSSNPHHIKPNFQDRQNFKTLYKLFICFNDDWEECVETLEVREQVATFLDEKLKNSGLLYEINTAHDSWA